MQRLSLPWLMFEFSFNSNAPRLVSISACGISGVPPKIDLGGSSVAVVHGLHGSRYADIH
jgi:hypothetical protein